MHPPSLSGLLHTRCALGVCVALGLGASAPALADRPVTQLHEVKVIAIAPLPGFEVPSLEIPLNVQSAQADDMAQLHGQAITDLLEANFQGVNVTQSQGNPWQGNAYGEGAASTYEIESSKAQSWRAETTAAENAAILAEARFEMSLFGYPLEPTAA